MDRGVARFARMVTDVKGYAFPNSWALARRRLALLEAVHDPSSFRRAQALGVGRNWRCLDAGAGNGSFARWLAGRVGPSGSVLAVDLDVRLLEEISDPRIEVRRMDLVTDELPPDAFDFVHTRLLLIHLPERDAVLRQLAAALRPGGVLMVEEDDVHPVLATATGAYGDAWETFLKMARDTGIDSEWARGLPERLDALGLVGVRAEIDSQLFRGGSTLAQLWSLSWLQARGRVVAMGLDGERIDAGRDALEDPARWFHGPAKVIAWGWRPGGTTRGRQAPSG
jgi:SAM-dependent methyltransferase